MLKEVEHKGFGTALRGWTFFDLKRVDDTKYFNTTGVRVACRRGSEWYFPAATYWPRESLHEWLLESIGESYETFWPFDRLFYGEEINTLPDIGTTWRVSGEEIPESRRNWIWFVNDRRIGFRTPEQAVMFKVAWG